MPRFRLSTLLLLIAVLAPALAFACSITTPTLRVVDLKGVAWSIVQADEAPSLGEVLLRMLLLSPGILVAWGILVALVRRWSR